MEGFCGIDPLHTRTVALSADGQSMTLNPEGQDDCGDRVAVLQGAWTVSSERRSLPNVADQRVGC